MAKSKLNRVIRLVSKRDDLNLDVAAFLIDRQARNLSAHTVEFYRKQLAVFESFCLAQGVTDVGHVTAGVIRLWLVELQTHRNAGGVAAAYRAVKCFLRWWALELADDGWKNPIERVASPRVPSEVLAAVSLDDVRAMVATCQARTLYGDRDRAMLLALLDTGCRASEFVGLNVGDVNLASGAVIVRCGKGGKARAVFVVAKTRREIMRYLRHRPDAKPGDPLWLSQDLLRLTYAGLREMVRRRARYAGVAEPSLHAFRRAFALGSLRDGADLVSLQRLMGHADLTVLRRYLAQTEGDLSAVHERTSPVNAL